MQTDMHYYGTYAMARAAGLKPEASEIIATCAQFVDDNASDLNINFSNGARVESIATAHHTFASENLDLSDQRRVWIPFHFLPGNIGNSWTERLKCRMDSPIAHKMIDHHLSLHTKNYALALIGITAHVYADTFSHYGFSGISSRGNRIDNSSIVLKNLEPEIKAYIEQKYEKFKNSKGAQLQPNFQPSVSAHIVWVSQIKNFAMSALAEKISGALGHGPVATFPDRPYLEWSFDYERPDAYLQSLDTNSDINAVRPNPETFLKGCEALHHMFSRFRECRPDLDNKDHRDFKDIKNEVAHILGTQADMAGRIDAWQRAAANGSVFDGTPNIPSYHGTQWNMEWNNLNGLDNSDILLNKPIWHFYQAAAIHRTYVLRDLLPAEELIIN